MSLVEHARRELELCGQAAHDPEYAGSIVKAVEAFASYGHSGGSASVAIEQLNMLLRFQPLSDLTDAPDEWLDHSGSCGRPLWQCRRDPRAMSHDGGKTYWLVDDESKTMRSSVRAARPITSGMAG